MEQYRVLGFRDECPVLGTFEYHPYVDGQLILVIRPDVYYSKGYHTNDGRLMLGVVRRQDAALFTVPVFRTLAQLRARTRVTREPRRVTGEVVSWSGSGQKSINLPGLVLTERAGSGQPVYVRRDTDESTSAADLY